MPGLARGHAHDRVEHEVQTRLNTAITAIGGRPVLNQFFGLAIGGMVSGAVHDMEGNRGVRVNSKAHPAPWTAYGDDLLDDPRNKESRAEAVTAVQLSKADIDLAYKLAENESKAKDAAPLPTALPATVFFKFDHSDILPAGQTALRGAVQYMIYHLEASVALEGHTDPIGKVEYNQNLGERRAMAVANFLEARGIDKRRLSVSSAGETESVTANPREFWRDRRVTLSWIEINTGVSHDVAFERARDAVKEKVGPPYKTEDHLPEPIDAANPALPDWKWGSIPASFKTEIAAWVRRQLPPHVAGVLKSPQLDPITLVDNTIPMVPIVVTVQPRPVVEGIISEILADPIAFLDSAFGVDAGP